MQDRIPLYPGRVKMTPVAGQANTYDMVRADDPTQAGTPLNKATLLKDATAMMVNLPNSAVPDDVLAFFAQYNLYWWRRRANGSHWAPVYGTKTNVQVMGSDSAGTYSVKLKYSDEIEFDSSGNVSLKNPTETTDPYTNREILNRTKYFQSTVYPGSDYGPVYYIPDDAADATYSYSNRTYYVYKECCTVTGQYINSIGDWSYLNSISRNAYPDSGTQDGYEYEYLGVPFDNAVTAPKIEVGSYVGTGKYGVKNPNTLTFGFVPKLVMFLGDYGKAGTQSYNVFTWYFSNGYNSPIVVMDILTDDYVQYRPPWRGGSSTTNPQAYSKKADNGKTLSWYNTAGFSNQLNDSALTYYYVAIG